jgi:hypothetical protein
MSSLPACSPSNEKADKQQIVASVEDKILYKTDLEGLVNKAASSHDSIGVINNYINAWIKKQALLTKAQKEVNLDEAEIERKIADYRYDLTIYAFQKQYIEQHLDTVVSESEIKAYYHENVANFELKQNIVQAVLVSLPPKSAQADKIKKLIKQVNKQSRDELKSLCFRYANFYTFTDSTWVDFDELVKNTPFREMPNKTQFLKQNKFTESTDEKGIYLLEIENYKVASQTSPLPFVIDQIKNIILNNRKVKLIHALEQQVYEQAHADKKIKIFATKTGN